jgi:hypothetical protein
MHKTFDGRRFTSLFFAALFTALSANAQSSGATIDSLASDLAALTARVAKLEGQIVAADLVGTYAIHGIQVELSGSGNSAQVSSYVLVGTVVLAADGTASLTTVAPSGNTLSIGSASSVSPFMGNGGGSGTGTWTYNADGTVTLQGGAPPLAVAAGGRILIGSSANNSDGTNVLLIFTRLQ